MAPTIEEERIFLLSCLFVLISEAETDLRHWPTSEHLTQLHELNCDDMVSLLRREGIRPTRRISLVLIGWYLKKIATEFLAREESTRKACSARCRPVPMFILFPDLPTEIRDMIWGYALPGPSIVEIYDTFEPDSIQLSKQVQLPVFSLLQTCRDSRAIATKLYECYAHPNGKILLNIESDILYCNSAVSAKELLLNAKTRAPHPKIVADRGKLKYVALNLREVKYFLLDDTGTYDFLALKSLEKVLVVIPRNNTWRREEKVPVAHRGTKLLFKPYVPRARVLPPNTLYVWPNDDIEQVIRWWELKFGSKNESNSMAHVSLEFVTVKRDSAPPLLSDMIYEFWKEEKALRPNQEGTLERS